jgi:hypothetical protein
MLKSTRKFKVFAMILLTCAVLLLTVNATISSVKAQTQDKVLVYTTLGGTISANGTALTGGDTYSYAAGATVTFTPTAQSGFKFLCFEYAGASGGVTSTSNPFSYTLSSSEIAIQAIFTTTKNATQTPTGSGAASVDLFAAIGGTTSPAGKTTPYTDYTIGTTASFTQTPGTGFSFLCWIVDTSAGATEYTSSTLSLKMPASSTAIQALWIPSTSTVTLPTIVSEFSSVMVAVIVAILALVAAGTYVYRRKAKN